jgi:hypothetical protein
MGNGEALIGARDTFNILGKDRPIRYTFGAAAWFETATGKDMMTKIDFGDLKVVKAFIVAGLIPDSKDVTPDQLLEQVDDLEFNVLEKFLDAYKKSQPKFANPSEKKSQEAQ